MTMYAKYMTIKKLNDKLWVKLKFKKKKIAQFGVISLYYMYLENQPQLCKTGALHKQQTVKYEVQIYSDISFSGQTYT